MSAARQTILLVEDNEVNRDMLVRRLQRAGHQVVTAGDGEAALAAMREQQPAVVLMDMNLPVKDGWTACREAQQDAFDCRNPHHCADRARHGGRQTSCA